MNELFSLFFHFFLHFSTNCVHVDKTTTNNNNNNHHFYFVFPLIWWVMYPHLIFICCGRVVCFNSYWSLLLVCVRPFHQFLWWLLPVIVWFVVVVFLFFQLVIFKFKFHLSTFLFLFLFFFELSSWQSSSSSSSSSTSENDNELEKNAWQLVVVTVHVIMVNE